MDLNDFTAVLLIVIGLQRGMLNFLMRNIWPNNHILSEQFTLYS